MSLFTELRRRKVIQLAIAYLAGSWLLIQVAETLLPVYGFGDPAIRATVAVLAIGFVPAVLMAWLFQRTPAGLKKQSELDRSDAIKGDTGPSDDDIVLAVLPFDNLSNDSETQFFSDGVSEEIIQRLSRGANLRLIGRTSSFQFRDERKAEAPAALRCSHLLDGAVRRADTRVRINAHLVETTSGTTLWSDRYDRSLEDIFAVQDDMAESIATALHQAFSSFSSANIDPEIYDLYLRSSLKSYAPEELRTNVGLLEVATQREPDFAEAWARLAYARAWLRFYEPFSQRASSGAQVASDANRALALDAQNADALVARLFVIAPFGRFQEAWEALERVRQAPVMGDGRKYIGWFLRHFGLVQESVDEDEQAYRSDPLDPMCANIVGLARMAAGRLEEAIPVFEELVERIPDMTFPFANLMRAQALLEDWEAVDELLELAKDRPLREFEDGLNFIRAKRDSSSASMDKWRETFVRRIETANCVDVSNLVYAAHLGLVDEVYDAAESACLGPVGSENDFMGPDGYRTSMLFQVRMPEIRQDPRFIQLCARLGLVEFWLASDMWPDCVSEVPYDFKAECEKSSQVSKDEFGY